MHVQIFLTAPPELGIEKAVSHAKIRHVRSASQVRGANISAAAESHTACERSRREHENINKPLKILKFTREVMHRGMATRQTLHLLKSSVYIKNRSQMKPKNKLLTTQSRETCSTQHKLLLRHERFEELAGRKDFGSF